MIFGRSARADRFSFAVKRLHKISRNLSSFIHGGVTTALARIGIIKLYSKAIAACFGSISTLLKNTPQLQEASGQPRPGAFCVAGTMSLEIRENSKGVLRLIENRADKKGLEFIFWSESENCRKRPSAVLCFRRIFM